MVPYIKIVLNLINRFVAFMSPVLREIGPHSRNYLKWKNAAPMLAVLTGVIGCSVCSTSIYQDEADICRAFEITDVQGLPGGPVTVSWINAPGLGPYFIGIGGTRVHGSGDAPAGASSGVVQIDQAAAQKTVNEGGTFSINVQYSMHKSGVDCTAWKDIPFPKQQQKKQQPKPTDVPTNPPPPPAPTQQPKPTDIPQPTPCPPGTSGDPSKGETCIPIPR